MKYTLVIVVLIAVGLGLECLKLRADIRDHEEAGYRFDRVVSALERR